MAFGLPKTHNVSTTPLSQETNTRQGNGNNKQTKRKKKNVDGRSDTSKLEKLDMATAKRKQRKRELINIQNRKLLAEAKRQQSAKRGRQRNVTHVKAKRPVGRPIQGLTENHAKPQYMTRERCLGNEGQRAGYKFDAPLRLCLLYEPSHNSWFKCRRFCKSTGGDLAYLEQQLISKWLSKNVRPVSLIQSLSAEGIWIGVNSNKLSCSFVGEGGMHLVFTHPCRKPKKCLCQKR